jgi:hypothetical protein
MAKAIASTSGKTNYCFADTLEPENRGGELLWTKIGFAVEEPFKLFADGTDIVLMRGNQPMMLQSSVIKKDAFDSCGGFLKELRYRDDTHLFMRLGLGQPICAVAGCGAVATADDVVENRLTLTFDHTEAGAYMNVIMYNDLLQTLDDLSEKSKSELRRRLGGSLRVMARRSWEQGEYQKAAVYLTRAAFVDPQRLIQRILTKIN